MSAPLPSFLEQAGPAAFTLTMSASFAEQMMLCAAKVAWSRVTGIEAATPRPGMNYGKGMHLLLAALYDGKPFDAGEILAEHFAANPQPEQHRGKPEWRTQARALQAFAAYNAAYPAESWEVLGVEEEFEVELGILEIEGRESDTYVKVIFRGIRDLRVRWHDAIWVVDHKTMTEWSDLTADEGKASFQFQGYAWVEREFTRGGGISSAGTTGQTRSQRSEQNRVEQEAAAHAGNQSRPLDLNIGGVIGNYLIARPPYSEGYKPRANALPRDQFERIPYPFSDAQLDEWHGRAMRLAKRIWTAWRDEEWDQHSTACAHWGRCEYYQLCWETDPAYRMSAALGADYRPRTPSPLDEADV